jgi:hypothetical protein
VGGETVYVLTGARWQTGCNEMMSID